jgi:hypothetical protein
VVGFYRGIYISYSHKLQSPQTDTVTLYHTTRGQFLNGLWSPTEKNWLGWGSNPGCFSLVYCLSQLSLNRSALSHSGFPALISLRLGIICLGSKFPPSCSLKNCPVDTVGTFYFTLHWLVLCWPRFGAQLVTYDDFISITDKTRFLYVSTKTRQKKLPSAAINIGSGEKDRKLTVGGLSQRPNLTEGPAATWDPRRSSKEEEERTEKHYYI